jgi:Ferritin-like
MMVSPAPTPKSSGLFARLLSGTDDREALQQAAQLALQVEFTTIPAYLSAMYSIAEPGSTAYQLLRSVVVEEMFHLNQAANLLIGIGGLPKLTGDAAPSYPTYLPKANRATTPFIGLVEASPIVFGSVFAAIEAPAPPLAPPQADQYDTIAQLYEALRIGLHAYKGPDLFKPNPEGRQRIDIYLGKFGGKPVVVDSLESADFAIQQIVQQGEGHAPWGKPLDPREKWGTYNYYGMRTDGTYGPIIGTPLESTHFVKFRTIALDTANFPKTRPIVSNPKIGDFTNPEAVQKAQTFDMAYSVMLSALEAAFSTRPHPAKDPYFGVALPLMHDVMPSLARSLMSTPALENGDPDVGPFAAPTFTYMPDADIAGLGKQVDASIGMVAQSTTPAASGDRVRATADAQARLAELHVLSRASTALQRLAQP